MAELSSIAKHFKKGKPHHTVVQFADGDKFWEYAISAKDKVRVFDDERFLFIDGCCIPFPEECTEMKYVGLSGPSVIFTSRVAPKDRRMVIITPDVLQPDVKIEKFSGHWYHGQNSEHPVVKKLLEMNNAREVHFFSATKEDRLKGDRLFAVGYDDEVFEIKLLTCCRPGGINRLLRSEEPPIKEQIVDIDTVLDIDEREACLIGKTNYRMYEGIGDYVTISGPNDVIKPGVLYWQII